MPADKRLKEYERKRDFGKTKEPRGGTSGKDDEAPIFVIQKHDARRLHYDVRFEVDGVLKSWAVPRGPSMNPSEKRLAVPTEDHPMEYASFEGMITPGEYGGGAVIVWDAGVYDVLPRSDGSETTMAEAIERGHFKVWLHGVKLNGGWALTRTGDDGNWLMVKLKDKQADARRNPTSTQPKSILTARTIEDVAAGR
ncbi:MAG TPA: DNA polymerase ligase N-terminal domain-containing protein [Kribbellaceae bacterium]|nr:DNA polymerase ligase N-terminal domain-containing protein [Kribbellaceae bacterium]